MNCQSCVNYKREVKMNTYSFYANSNDGCEISEKGFVTAESYTEAMRKVEAFYGGALEHIELELITDSELIIIPAEYEAVIKYIKENHIW